MSRTTPPPPPPPLLLLLLLLMMMMITERNRDTDQRSQVLNSSMDLPATGYTKVSAHSASQMTSGLLSIRLMWRSYHADSVGGLFRTIFIPRAHSVSTVGGGARTISKNEIHSAISVTVCRPLDEEKKKESHFAVAVTVVSQCHINLLTYLYDPDSDHAECK